MTLISMYYLILMCYGVSVLQGHQEVPEGSASFEVYLYTMFLTNVLDNFPEPFSVWYYHACAVFFYGSGLLLMLVL